MKIVVAIVVFNRYQNIEHWLKCWVQCDQTDAELVVIHTGLEREKFKELCDKNNVKYIPRENIGFDIGCLQDVFRERLPGFPSYDYLLWATDDTFVMQKDFIKHFIDPFKNPSIGITAMQISRSVDAHVRTTGFCISKSIASKIRFQVDPIKTKEHCYQFEHRSGKNTLTNQVRAMGLDCIQIAPIKKSPMWDSAHPNARLRLDRQAEHDKVFNPEIVRDKVTFICTIYNTYPQIISSLLLQTHKNWELILIHDGPSSNGMRTYIPDDDRITYIETDVRVGNWGHIYRQQWLQKVDSDFVVVTNADNYYVPVFIEYMLRGFDKSPLAVATYCSSMTHSYKAWDVIPCKLERGYIDSGGVIVRGSVAKEIGWRDIESHSSDFTYFSDIALKYGWKNFQIIKGNLFVHN